MAVQPVAISDETLAYLLDRGCFVKPLAQDEPLIDQLDRAAVELAAARCNRDSLAYHAALVAVADRI